METGTPTRGVLSAMGMNQNSWKIAVSRLSLVTEKRKNGRKINFLMLKYSPSGLKAKSNQNISQPVAKSQLFVKHTEI